MTVPGGRQIEGGRTSIDPGKVQKVAVTIPTRYIRTKDIFTKNIEVETNDPEAAIVRLTMKLKVVETLVITPSFVNFGNVKPLSENKSEITLLNKGKDPITITRIIAVPESVLSVSPSGTVRLEPGKSIACAVTYKPMQPDDRFLGTLQIETDLEYLKSKVIQVRASVPRK